MERCVFNTQQALGCKAGYTHKERASLIRKSSSTAQRRGVGSMLVRLRGSGAASWLSASGKRVASGSGLGLHRKALCETPSGSRGMALCGYSVAARRSFRGVCARLVVCGPSGGHNGVNGVRSFASKTAGTRNVGIMVSSGGVRQYTVTSQHFGRHFRCGDAAATSAAPASLRPWKIHKTIRTLPACGSDEFELIWFYVTSSSHQVNSKARRVCRGMCGRELIPQNVLIEWFQNVNSPKKSSTCCSLLLILTKS